MSQKIISVTYSGAVKVVHAEVDGRPVAMRGIPGGGRFSFVGKIKDFRASEETILLIYGELAGRSPTLGA